MLSDNITAYRKNQSCETSLLQLRLRQAMYGKNGWSSLFLSKHILTIFDSLHPQLLINNRKAYAFSDEALESDG